MTTVFDGHNGKDAYHSRTAIKHRWPFVELAGVLSLWFAIIWRCKLKDAIWKCKKRDLSLWGLDYLRKAVTLCNVDCFERRLLPEAGKSLLLETIGYNYPKTLVTKFCEDIRGRPLNVQIITERTTSKATNFLGDRSVARTKRTNSSGTVLVDPHAGPHKLQSMYRVYPRVWHSCVIAYNYDFQSYWVLNQSSEL